MSRTRIENKSSVLQGNRDTLEDNLDVSRDSISFISTISDRVEQNLFIKRVSEKLGIEQSLLKDKVRKASVNSKTTSRTTSPEKRTGKVDKVELNLIYMMIEYPEKIPVVVRDDILNCFASETLKELGKVITGGVGDTISLVGDLEDGPVKENLLKLMMESPFSDKEVADRVFDDNLRQIRNKWYKGRHNTLKRELIRARDANDRELSDNLLRERDSLLKEERGLFENEKNNQVG